MNVTVGRALSQNWQAKYATGRQILAIYPGQGPDRTREAIRENLLRDLGSPLP